MVTLLQTSAHRCHTVHHHYSHTTLSLVPLLGMASLRVIDQSQVTYSRMDYCELVTLAFGFRMDYEQLEVVL